MESILLDLATNDPDRTVQGTAIGLIGTYKKEEYKALFIKKTTDSSYTVAGNALTALEFCWMNHRLTNWPNEFSKYPAKGDLILPCLRYSLKKEMYPNLIISLMVLIKCLSQS